MVKNKRKRVKIVSSYVFEKKKCGGQTSRARSDYLKNAVRTEEVFFGDSLFYTVLSYSSPKSGAEPNHSLVTFWAKVIVSSIVSHLFIASCKKREVPRSHAL
jgi:hypothetical protein